MNEVKYPSVLLENLVEELHKLPGVGKKTALRYALHLLKSDEKSSIDLGNSILKFRSEVIKCSECHNISDSEICEICANPKRNSKLVCVVESVSDVMAIENTAQFDGVYHILGGIISPMNGIGPADLEILSLVDRVSDGDVEEVILALSPDMEGDTTALYLYRKLSHLDIDISTIARGVAVGNSLEYADEITLGRSIVNRVKYSL
ncbi:MAG: recombination protein RecR [Bacteroidales bacterium]|nr:MAG: recombination protein RecR [Bacteroidales bacterium]